MLHASYKFPRPGRRVCSSLVGLMRRGEVSYHFHRLHLLNWNAPIWLLGCLFGLLVYDRLAITLEKVRIAVMTPQHYQVVG
jgi:hypothetical protein